MNDLLITTANDLAGYRIVEQLGLVRGLTVRSRSLLGTIGAAFQSMAGGNISLFTELAERSRQEALDLLIQHARQLGANAIIAMRYDANEITDGVTEVLAYGTAVKVERL
ncbi:MAG TPA: heavy metal-binding domain-containing protein [Deinococcales bacterium]|nr:heavy metal-binding domain-containing protein [Deinococcales bacterium]